MLFVALALLTATLVSAPPSEAVENPPMFLGMATLNMGSVYPEFASQAGNYPAMHQVYWKLHEPWTQTNFDWHADQMVSYGMAFCRDSHGRPR